MSRQKSPDIKPAPPEKFKSSTRLNNQKKNSISSKALSSSKQSECASQDASIQESSMPSIKRNVASTTKSKSSDSKNSTTRFSHAYARDKNTSKQAGESVTGHSQAEITVRKTKNTRPTSTAKSSYKSETVSSHKKSKATNPVVSSNKQSAPKPKSISNINREVKVRPSSAPARKTTTNFVLKNATRPASSSKTSNHQVPSSKNAFNVSSTKQRLAVQHKPLQSNKKSNKGLPPTAVVSPIQDRSKTLSLDSKKEHIDDTLLDKKLKKPLIGDLALSKHGNQTVSFDKFSPAEASSLLTESLNAKDSSAEDEEEIDSKLLEVGHYFKPCELKQWVNWCDACGGVIVTMFGAALSCKKCNMLCHSKCALAVSLTCAADEDKQDKSQDDEKSKVAVEETTDESTLKEYNTIKRVIPADEVQERIDVFNQTVKGIHQMTLQEDGETFRGFVRVSMNLVRPVSVSEQTFYKGGGEGHKASFYVDKGALKALHITSDTTAEQVVRTLLRKYNITDNPMKFALFEKQVKEEEHVILRKMLPRERPLLLRLLWGNSNSEREFLLQENESRDIEWEAFSVAELQMFIKILDKEENDYEMEIKRRYKNKAEDIKKAIDFQKRKS